MTLYPTQRGRHRPSEKDERARIRGQRQRGQRCRHPGRAGRAAGRFIDLHSDRHHHRSVFTLVGEDADVQAGVRGLARSAVELLDLRGHTGAYPRFGVLDVVPWVALEGWPLRDAGPGPRRPPARPTGS